MQIGWLIPTVGMVGAVREMVEAANVMVDRGHQITIYHPTGEPCEWLPCRADTKRVTALAFDRLDALISLSDWMPDMHRALDAAQAKVKAICVVGFDPTPDVEAVWNGKKPARDIGEDLQRLSIRKYHVLTDSSWQRDWLKVHCKIDSLPPFGGVNLEQFHPVPQRHSKNYFLVGSTGDPRTRKGGKTIIRARNLIREAGIPVRFTEYWHKGIAQDKMRDWYSDCDVFLDAERRAGWANPVAEAMACGAPIVSTDIGAVHDFAIHEKTALLVPIDNHKAMAEAAVKLLKDRHLRERLSMAGLERINQFSYEHMIPPLLTELQRLVNGH